MTDLWKQILDNLSFVGVSLAIVVGLALLARLAEHFLPEKRKVSPALMPMMLPRPAGQHHRHQRRHRRRASCAGLPAGDSRAGIL